VREKVWAGLTIDASRVTIYAWQAGVAVAGVVGLQDLARILSPALLRQEIERQGVGLAVEVFEEGVVEEGVVSGSSQKQGHAGPEFEMVRISEDLLSATPVHVENQLRTGSEPGTEGRVLQISFSLHYS
jgi:hypothetical protein